MSLVLKSSFLYTSIRHYAFFTIDSIGYGGALYKNKWVELSDFVMYWTSWLGKNGIHDYVKVKDDVAAQEIVNSRLKQRNEQLFAEINDLNDG